MLAGLTPAPVLTHRGFPVTVFEQGRCPGGRTTTLREVEYFFDHWFQYLTVHDERFQRYLDVWAEQGVVSAWKMRLANAQEGVLTPLLDETRRWVGVPGMNAIAKRLADGLEVEQGVRVNALMSDEAGWSLVSEQPLPDEKYEIVVVATPPDQAVPLLAQSPSLQASAASVRMQPCWAVMLAFEYDLELSFDAAFVRGSPLVWVCNNGSKPGRPGPESWVLHASPAWSRVHLEDTPEQVAADLVEAVERLLSARLAEQGLHCEHGRWNEEARIEADRDLMEQALYGLLNNAVEASPQGATLWLSVHEENDEVRIAIADEGGGVPFQPEPGELTPGPSTKRFGTGLGIPIAYKICHTHDFRLEFHIEPGQGTEVVIRAPASRRE